MCSHKSLIKFYFDYHCGFSFHHLNTPPTQRCECHRFASCIRDILYAQEYLLDSKTSDPILALEVEGMLVGNH
jgi:hypothetical protein